jgi:hypothetical protein
MFLCALCVVCAKKSSWKCVILTDCGAKNTWMGIYSLCKCLQCKPQCGYSFHENAPSAQKAEARRKQRSLLSFAIFGIAN